MNQVKVDTSWVRTWLVAMIISGCALQPAMPPVTDPTMRYTGIGYSALPPTGKDWYLKRHGPYALAFEKVSPGRFEGDHTFGAGVLVHLPEVKKVHSPAEFPKAVQELFTARLTGVRFRLISVKTVPFGPQGSYCSQYDMLQEERDNPIAPGIVLEITAHGFICLDTSSKYMINACYSERKPQGSKSFIDDALKQEAEGFLRDIVVTPLR